MNEHAVRLVLILMTSWHYNSRGSPWPQFRLASFYDGRVLELPIVFALYSLIIPADFNGYANRIITY